MGICMVCPSHPEATIETSPPDVFTNLRALSPRWQINGRANRFSFVSFTARSCVSSETPNLKAESTSITALPHNSFPEAG